MPRYIIERNVDVKSMTQEELDAGGRLSLEVANSMPGLRWIRKPSWSPPSEPVFPWTRFPKCRWKSAPTCFSNQ